MTKNDESIPFESKMEKSNKEFENHWLWRELQTTPKEFFAKLHDMLRDSGVSQKIWQEKLHIAKQQSKFAKSYQSVQPVDFTKIKNNFF